MSGTHTITMGDRGRLVVPAEVRDRNGLREGVTLVMVESDAGLVLLTREQLKTRVRADLADTNLVADLLTERRAAALDEAG
jgi:AbrB family looped-hinge helix DNA binding protein